MNGRTVRTPKTRAVFLSTLADTCNVEAACRAVGIAKSAAYRWRNNDAAFRAEWDATIEGFVNEAHAMMLRQAASDEGPAGVESRKVVLRAYMPEVYNRGLMLRHQMMQLALEEKRQQLGMTIDGQVVNGNGQPMIYPRPDMERPMTVTKPNAAAADTTLGLAVWIDATLELAERAEENDDGP